MKKHSEAMSDQDRLADAWLPREKAVRSRCSCARCCQGRPCDALLTGGPCEHLRCVCRGVKPRELNFEP